MKYKVVALRRADADVRNIVEWIAQQSLQGAKSWLDAYEQLLEHLATHADTYPAALEDPDCAIALREALFRTRHGRAYRAVFTIVGDEVRVLRIRGPGQPPQNDNDLI